MSILVTILALVLANPALCSERLDLDAVLKYAQQHSPEYLAAKNSLEMAEDELKNANSAFLPKLDLESTNGWQGSDPSTLSGPWQGSLSLALKQDFYLNHQNILERRTRRLSLERARIEFERIAADVKRDVASSFYTFSRIHYLLGVEKEQLKLVDKQFESVSRQYRQGLKTQKDFLRFKSETRRSRLRLLALENSKKSSEQDLLGLIGRPLKQRDVPVEWVPENIEYIHPKKLRQTKIDTESHYTYQTSVLNRKINDIAVYRAQRNYWPQVSFAGGLSYGASDYFQNNFASTDSLNWNVLLSLKFNLLDWGILRRNISIAEKNKDIKGRQIDRTLLDLKATHQKLLLDLQRIADSYELSRELLTLEEQSFSVLEREYKQGKVPFVDLIRGLDTLSSARSNFYTIHFEALSKLAEYQYHTGAFSEEVDS